MSMGKMIEKVFIIVPLFNMEDYIEKCLESIFNQTYKNIEIIVVDDGSSDNGGSICDRIAKEKSNLTVIHQINKGLSGARNSGIELALQKIQAIESKAYIGFIDSDDYIHPDMIASLVNIANSTQSRIVGVGAKIVNTNDNFENHEISDLTYEEISDLEFARAYLTHKISVSVCNKLFDISLFEKYRFSEGRLNEDGLLLYEMFLKEKCSYAYTEEPLYYYLMREGSITHSGFSKSIIDMIGNFLNIEKITQLYANTLCKEANDNFLYGCAVFCNTVPMEYFIEKSETVELVISEVRKRRNRIVCSNLNKRDKIVLLVFSLFPKLAIRITNLYRNRIKIMLRKIG